MIIKKVLNNNAVVVQEKNEKEKIVTGKGLAFQKRSGDRLDVSKIDKVFTIDDPRTMNKLQQLVKNIPMEYLSLAETIVAYGRTRLGKKLNDTIYISLSDHIYTSVMRFLEGIRMPNPLLLDIKRFYPDEYGIGIKALDYIEKVTKVRLPQEEAGFIALHFVNAQMEQSDLDDMMKITQVMQEVSNIVKYTFKIEFDEESVYYYRFVTHLKFFAQRLVHNKTYAERDETELLEIIKKKYHNAYDCVLKIADFLSRKYQYTLSSEEILYLTIHVERIVYQDKD